MLEEMQRRLPFALVRHILDYICILPKFSIISKNTLIHHFQKRICHKCGEYLDFPSARLGNKRDKRPRHLTCRSPKFESVQHNHHYYYRCEVPSSAIFHPEYLQTAPFSGVISGETSILLRLHKSTPLFWNEIYAKECLEKKLVRRFFFRPLELRRYPYSLYTLEMEDFIVIPSFLRKESTSYIGYYLNNMIWRDDSMGHFMTTKSLLNKFKLSHLVFDMLEKVSMIWYDRHYCGILEYVIRNCQNDERFFKYELLKRFDLDSMAVQNISWLRQILFEFPQLLDKMSEEAIQTFFDRNRRWFLSKLCPLRPCVYQYITLTT